MKTSKRGQPARSRRREALLQGFLALSVVFAVAILGCNDDLTTPVAPTPEPPTIEPPGALVESSASSSYTEILFAETVKGVTGSLTDVPIGWAMGALGLADESPDYTEQLKKIDEDLQEMIMQLDSIEAELASIDQELKVLDCSEQEDALTIETGRIEFILELYNSFVSTANVGGRTSNTTLSDWADQVLAQGIYASQTPMGQILTTMADQLLQPSSGAITACVRAVPKLANDTFSDTTYYDAVSHFTNYYYYYQTQGLMLLTEALHYKAWVAAGSPTSPSADSVSFVCQDSNALGLCLQAATVVNTVYNALTAQFRTAGAPYTDDDFLMQNHDSDPRLWVRSLEDFTAAAGDNCESPLTSSPPCGLTADFYDSRGFPPITFQGYTDWNYVNMQQWSILLSGWNSGTVGNFLETTRGFKNMLDKIIQDTAVHGIRLTHSNLQQDFVCFISTDFDHSFQPNVVCDDTSFDRLVSLQTTTLNCWYNYYVYEWTVNAQLPNLGTGYYAVSAKRIDPTETNCKVGMKFTWSDQPGYLASNRGPEAKQYRWPVGEGGLFTDHCIENGSSQNTGGVWTMCGDDFIAWFDAIVPRPPTCDNSAIVPSCVLPGMTEGG